MELDTESPIFNFHFDFNYREEPSLYSHEDNNCVGHIITKSGYCIYCSNPNCSKAEEVK